MPKYYIGNMPCGHDDKNELMHYGRKGMKWGKDIFGRLSDAVSNTFGGGHSAGSGAGRGIPVKRSFGQRIASGARAVSRTAANAYSATRSAAGTVGRAMSRTAANTYNSARAAGSRFVDKHITGESAKRRSEVLNAKADNKQEVAGLIRNNVGRNNAQARYASNESRVYRNAANEAEREYNRTVAGRLNSARNAVSGAASRVRDAAGNVASRGRNAASRAGNAIGNAVSSGRNKASRFIDENITGETAKKQMREYNNKANVRDDLAKAERRNTGENTAWAKRKSNEASIYRNAAKEAEGRYDRTVAGRLNSARNAVGNAASRAKEAAGDAVNKAETGIEYTKARAKYAGWKAKRKAGEVADKVKTGVEYTKARAKYEGYKAKKKLGKAVDSAKGAAKGAARKAKGAAKGAASKVKGAAGKGKEFLANTFGRKKK